jgi:GR25 family glycosyltransferase involved in LPS biosynthesis
MSFNFTTPILIICFNRPQYIVNQVNVLRELAPRKIYISSDGARENRSDEKIKVKNVRELYLKEIDWDCDIKVNFSDNNLGCFLGVSSGMKWFFNHEPEGIILEDDILPSLDFFRFMQAMLEKYRENDKVISISGCNFGYDAADANGYLFCKVMNMWGWATWAKEFKNVDFQMKQWKEIKNPKFFLYHRLRSNLLDLDINWVKYFKEKFDSIELGRIDTWDYQFMFYQLKNKKLSIYPNRNLVKNLGFDADATHTVEKNNPMVNVVLSEIIFPLKNKVSIKENRFFYENYLKPIWALYQRPNWKYYLGNILK